MYPTTDQLLNPKVSGEDMLRRLERLHQGGFDNDLLTDAILRNEWTLVSIPASELPRIDDARFDEDPYQRTIFHDESRIAWWRARMQAGMDIPPICQDENGFILDGNHRAVAAGECGYPLQAYRPG